MFDLSEGTIDVEMSSVSVVGVAPHVCEAAVLPSGCDHGDHGMLGVCQCDKAYAGVDIETVYAALDTCGIASKHMSKHARAVQGEIPVDIILVSGAGCSVLPLCYGACGKHVRGRAGGANFMDAQQNPLKVRGQREANVNLGGVLSRERFHVAPVTSPLMRMGHLYRAGYYVRPDDDYGLVLTNGDVRIPMAYRNQSFMIKGSMSMISSVVPEPVTEHVRAMTEVKVTLSSSLVGLSGSWASLEHGVVGLKSMSSHAIDTTLMPLQRVLWKRTTLVQRSGQ